MRQVLKVPPHVSQPMIDPRCTNPKELIAAAPDKGHKQIESLGGQWDGLLAPKEQSFPRGKCEHQPAL
jgi:hypothetical protein